MLRDLLNGVRVARRSPSFTVAAVLLVGFGVGANAAIFTVARALVYQPLPFQDPGRLASVWRESRQDGVAYGISWPDLDECRGQRRLFEGVEAYVYATTNATSNDSGSTSGPVSEFRVTEGFLRLLGRRPVMGRWFSPGEVQPLTRASGPTVEPVLLSHEFWQQRLLGRPDVLGLRVTVDASSRIVIGVLPRGFRILRNDVPEIFSPLRPYPDHLSDRRMTYLQAVARLSRGVGIERARQELDARPATAAARAPSEALLAWRIGDLHDRLFGSARPAMALLLATAAVVLLIACANLAILLLARARARHREMTIRVALGAGRLHIARQLLAESLVLSVIGAGAGLLFAAWAADFLSTFSATIGLGLPAITLDSSVLGFTLLLSLATGTLFGLAPVLHLWNVRPAAELRGGGVASRSLAASFLGGGLVVGEVALSMMLLTGAGVLLQGFLRVTRVDPGFRGERVLALSIASAPQTPGWRREEAPFWSRLVERVRAVPGVRSAAFSGALPLAERQAPENMKALVTLPAHQLRAPGYLEAEYQDVSPGYFQTMGIPLRSGRDFHDGPADSSAVIINESFSRECWGAANPLGAQLDVPGGRPYTIVGIVGDVRQYDLRSAPQRRQIYRPLLRSDVSTLSKWPSQYLAVRTSGDPGALAPLLRDLVRSVDPRRPVLQARTVHEISSRSTAWDRVKTTIVGAFGVSALLLTVVGLYAVLSHGVSRRRREIAVRVALGGRPSDIGRMIVGRGLAVTLAGVGIGALGVLALAPLAANRIFGVTALDLLALAPVAFVLLAAGFAACLLPARRATRTDPLRLLQVE